VRISYWLNHIFLSLHYLFSLQIFSFRKTITSHQPLMLTSLHILLFLPPHQFTVISLRIQRLNMGPLVGDVAHPRSLVRPKHANSISKFQLSFQAQCLQNYTIHYNSGSVYIISVFLSSDPYSTSCSGQ